MQIGSSQAPYTRFLKLFARWDRRAKLLRLGRYVYASGTPGVPGGGYTAKLSLALTPRLFRIERGFREWGVTLLGVRIHHLKSHGGWMA